MEHRMLFFWIHLQKKYCRDSILKLLKFGWIDKNTLIILEKGKGEFFKSGFKLIVI